MKIDVVITACDTKKKYIENFKYIYNSWKSKLGVETYLILITNPEENPNDFIESKYLVEFKKNIIVFPVFDDIHSTYIAQVVRILYPALFENKNVLITDADIIPLKADYYTKQIEELNDDVFITYTDRYIKQKNYAICYNVANSNTWRNIFNINTVEDIKNKIKEWYLPEYTGDKNCIGWYHDQEKLFDYVNRWQVDNPNRFLILTDKETGFNRLDKKDRDYIITNMTKVLNDIKSGIYTDYHFIKPHKNNMFLKEITEAAALYP